MTKGVNIGYNSGYKRGDKMTREECIMRIEMLTKQIEDLPKGYISTKEIDGKKYFYHQWSENGTKKSRYIKDEELPVLLHKIAKRKALQLQIKSLKEDFVKSAYYSNAIIPNIHCILMHKNRRVIELDIDKESGTIDRIGMVYAIEHLPVGTVDNNGGLNKIELNKWWMDRSIPASRSGIQEALESLHIDSTKTLLARCYGLSLSDQYWICPEESDLKWEDVNFFNNEFSEDIGDILFGKSKKENAINFSSPDCTSDGNLKKRWKIIDGKRCLIKGGSNPYRQQPINEVIATKIMECLKVPCIPYSLLWNKGVPYSICDDFVNEKTELITAWHIMKTQKKQNNVSLYRHFVNCAEKLGIPNVVDFLDRMIVIDYLILNEDRHLNNFGALRNADTLEWIGMAPIYDSGSSLGYDKNVALMKDSQEVICKPFKNNHEDQLKLVTSFDWIDFESLSSIGTIIKEAFSDERVLDYMDERRIDMICDLAEQRVIKLKEYATNHIEQSETLENEVKENKAAKY